uniref:Uncharacterized protein n=1 Tax=Romanomermis culicivorax TaxID=13658 RepID=A0A915KYE8_ROMCU
MKHQVYGLKFVIKLEKRPKFDTRINKLCNINFTAIFTLAFFPTTAAAAGEFWAFSNLDVKFFNADAALLASSTDKIFPPAAKGELWAFSSLEAKFFNADAALLASSTEKIFSPTATFPTSGFFSLILFPTVSVAFFSAAVVAFRPSSLNVKFFKADAALLASSTEKIFPPVAIFSTFISFPLAFFSAAFPPSGLNVKFFNADAALLASSTDKNFPPRASFPSAIFPTSRFFPSAFFSAAVSSLNVKFFKADAALLAWSTEKSFPPTATFSAAIFPTSRFFPSTFF